MGVVFKMSGEWSGVAARFADLDVKGSTPRKALDSSISATIERATLLDGPINCDINPNEIEVGKKLGKGAFGTVYKGKLHGKDVAIKKLHVTNLDAEAQEDFKAEMMIMSKLRHPNVVLFMGSCMQPDNYMMITELMPRGSLYDILHDKNIQLSFKQKMKMAKDAALGMNWLHCSKPVFIHRDLKTQNLLVDTNWTVKVADFGLSHIKKHEKPGSSGSYGSIGTPLWMAPEVLQNKPYDESADVYSFGIVLWELLTQEDPFKEVETFSAMIDSVVGGHKRPTIPENCPKKLARLIEVCWDADPKKRPTFSQIIPLFDNIIVDAVLADRKGKDMWKKYFMGEKLRESVSWKNFVIAICSFFDEKISKNPNDTRWKCLAALLSDKESRVTIEQFSRILEWFGPLTDLTSFLQSVEDLLSKPWFHGEISAVEAEKLLSPKPAGTFLVRFSSRDPGCYAISVMGKGSKLKHYRVYHKPGLQYLIGNSECSSIYEIISKYGKDLNLQQACSGSPFESLFTEVFSIGYDVVEFDNEN